MNQLSSLLATGLDAVSGGDASRMVRHRDRRRHIHQLLFGVVFAAAFGWVAQDGHPVEAQASANSTAEGKPTTESAAKALKVQQIEAAESARKKQIAEESTQLLAMALSLKAEVDKTNKDTLSLKVIRKADEVERLAKTVREKLKQGSGAS